MANKEAAVAELTEHFRSSSAIVLTEYRGLSVTPVPYTHPTLPTNHPV